MQLLQMIFPQVVPLAEPALTSKPCRERLKTFIQQIGNPYCYLDNGIVVEIAYADTKTSLQDRLSAYANCIDPTTGKSRK